MFDLSYEYVDFQICSFNLPRQGQTHTICMICSHFDIGICNNNLKQLISLTQIIIIASKFMQQIKILKFVLGIRITN